MGWTTSVPTAALIALPITWVAGPVAAFNILTLAARPSAAISMYLLARQLTGRNDAALAGGALFGFSGYENGQALGHLNLDLVFLLPLIPLLVVRRWQGLTGRRRFVGLLACVLLAQFGISSELLALAVVCRRG